MLIRRLASALKNQDWATFVIEFFLVVAGVFIGIQFANWNDERNLRLQEGEVLVSLSGDLEEAIPAFNETILSLQDQRARQNELAEVIQGRREKPDAAQLDRLILDSIYFMRLPKPRRASIDELASSGRINIIDDVAIREQILKIEPMTVEVEQSMQELQQLVFDKVDPYLIKNYDMRGLTTITDSALVSEFMRVWSEDYDRQSNQALLQQTELSNLLIYRMGIRAVMEREVTRLRDAFQTTNNLIEARLTALGQ